MTELSAQFAPGWVLPPGESILDLADERGWQQGELARRLGYSEKHISQLVNGKVPLTVDAALRLERVLGSTVDFWLTLEANYQKHKARLESAERHGGWVSWLDELPLKELMACGVIPKQRLDAKNKPGLVEACLRFYGVASPDDWRAHYQFWFTFFHEAAHILLHANSKEDRKSIFLDDPNAAHAEDPQEHEANQWAGDYLIPAQYIQELPSLRSKAAVVDFARRINIHPGIVVGRLQHDGLIAPSWMNDLKCSLRFQGRGKD